MTFEITLNEAHYNRYVGLLLGGAYDGKIAKSHYPDFKCIVMVTTAIVMFMAGALAPWDTMQIALRGCAIGFCLGWLVTFLIEKIQLSQYRRKFAPTANDPLFNITTYNLDDQNICWRTNSGENTYAAKQLHKLADDEQLVLLFKSNREAFIFPKDQLNEEHLDFIRSWASTHMPLARPSDETA